MGDGGGGGDLICGVTYVGISTNIPRQNNHHPSLQARPGALPSFPMSIILHYFLMSRQ